MVETKLASASASNAEAQERCPVSEPQWMNGPVVTVKVGSEKTDFYIHKLLLRTAGDFFVKSLDGPFKEAQENLLVLPGVRVNSFRLFVKWLYCGELRDIECLISAYIQTPAQISAANDLWGLLHFVEIYCEVSFRDTVEEELAKLRHNVKPGFFTEFTEEAIVDMSTYVYNNSRNASLARREFVLHLWSNLAGLRSINLFQNKKNSFAGTVSARSLGQRSHRLAPGSNGLNANKGKSNSSYTFW